MQYETVKIKYEKKINTKDVWSFLNMLQKARQPLVPMHEETPSCKAWEQKVNVSYCTALRLRRGSCASCPPTPNPLTFMYKSRAVFSCVYRTGSDQLAAAKSSQT